jgi:hypothetical protein
MEEETKPNPPKRIISPDHTLYLPVGSIRAIVMLVLLFSSIGMVFYSKTVPEWLFSMTIAAFSFYFGSKNDTKKAK